MSALISHFHGRLNLFTWAQNSSTWFLSDVKVLSKSLRPESFFRESRYSISSMTAPTGRYLTPPEIVRIMVEIYDRDPVTGPFQYGADADETDRNHGLEETKAVFWVGQEDVDFAV